MIGEMCVGVLTDCNDWDAVEEQWSGNRDGEALIGELCTDRRIVIAEHMWRSYHQRAVIGEQ